MTAAEARKARDEALDDLDSQWGAVYDIAVTRDGWVAKRLGDGQALTASSPDELRERMAAADSRLPPPSARIQAAALRAAFPQYTVNVLTWPGDRTRFEAVSRTGGSPYCLISADAREIWRELRQHA